MSDILNYLVFGIVLIAALLLGRWYAVERDRLLARGEPWMNSFKTKPGILILVCLGILIILKFKYA